MQLGGTRGMCGELEFEVGNLGGAVILRHVKGYLSEGGEPHLIVFVIGCV
jgi:hypothetical protein